MDSTCFLLLWRIVLHLPKTYVSERYLGLAQPSLIGGLYQLFIALWDYITLQGDKRMGNGELKMIW